MNYMRIKNDGVCGMNWLTVKDAAEILKTSEQTVRKMYADGEFAHTSIVGNKFLIGDCCVYKNHPEGVKNEVQIPQPQDDDIDAKEQNKRIAKLKRDRAEEALSRGFESPEDLIKRIAETKKEREEARKDRESASDLLQQAKDKVRDAELKAQSIELDIASKTAKAKENLSIIESKIVGIQREIDDRLVEAQKQADKIITNAKLEESKRLSVVRENESRSQSLLDSVLSEKNNISKIISESLKWIASFQSCKKEVMELVLFYSPASIATRKRWNEAPHYSTDPFHDNSQNGKPRMNHAELYSEIVNKIGELKNQSLNL